MDSWLYGRVPQHIGYFYSNSRVVLYKLETADYYRVARLCSLVHMLVYRATQMMGHSR